MKFRASFFVIVAATIVAAVAATAFAAPAAKDPSSLILRKADMPAGAQYQATVGDDSGIGDSIEAQGVETNAAGYLGASYSKTKGFLQVTGVVFTTASPAKAKKAFAVAKKARAAFWKRLGGNFKPISLPAYGNEQSALYDAPGGEGIALVELLVRKNTGVWWLAVKLERRPAPPNSEVLSEVKTYASKQKARVRRG